MSFQVNYLYLSCPIIIICPNLHQANRKAIYPQQYHGLFSICKYKIYNQHYRIMKDEQLCILFQKCFIKDTILLQVCRFTSID